MIFEYKIDGIPCSIKVTAYRPPLPETYHEPSDPSEADFVVLNRNGSRAKWLEDKLSQEDLRRIEAECIRRYEAWCDDERDEQRIDDYRSRRDI